MFWGSKFDIKARRLQNVGLEAHQILDVVEGKINLINFILFMAFILEGKKMAHHTSGSA